MKLPSYRSAAASTLAGAALVAVAVLALAGPALAGNDPTPNPGDVAWMLTSALLVLMMSIPGLALFYGGLVRTKNMLSILTQTFAIVSLVGVIWAVYGYSIAFGDGGNRSTISSAASQQAFLKGVTAASNAPTFTPGHVIPEYVFFVFQMTFAMITPALIVVLLPSA
ncbi:hypothetical protein [Methylocystis parvus]|uniref:hypothetical protein n=1 Tax=Methylocystis parvus TaxID=134 RepID=UPI003C72FA64